MSRIISPDNAGKDRTRMVKSIIIAIRELGKKVQPDDEARDMAAYIVMALEVIANTIEESVKAWEKRDYWVKADRFRMEWAWSQVLSKQMEKAVLNEDWGEIAYLIVQIAQRLGKISVSENHRMGKPWIGAWEKLKISHF
ncbi:MAG: hypothetical protein WCI88_04410 [Chloroflexota bacterium]